MTRDGYEGLTPQDELELRQMRKAEREYHAATNAMLRQQARTDLGLPEPEPVPHGDSGVAARNRGPRPMTTRAEVEAKRSELDAANRWSGERSIGLELGVSRDAVRYALGKDRRNPK